MIGNAPWSGRTGKLSGPVLVQVDLLLVARLCHPGEHSSMRAYCRGFL